MPPDAPWADDVENLFHYLAGHELTPYDEQQLRNADFSIEELRENFEQAFTPEQGLDYDQLQDLRYQFIDWMHYLDYGWDSENVKEFWNEWRDWYKDQ